MIRLKKEAERCLLCADAPCSSICTEHNDPAGMIRSIRFSNEKVAADRFEKYKCVACPGPCESVCIHEDFPVRIRQMAKQLENVKIEYKDLRINFCGIECENPFFLSSSVVASGYEMCAKALDAGWAGIVYKTIGTLVPKEASPRFAAVGAPGSPFIGFKNIEQISDHPLEEDLKVLKKLKENYPSKVIVGSIMGTDEDDWTDLARMCTGAGCDIIECNFSCPHMTAHGVGADVGTNPELVAKYTAAVRRGTDLPILAKMTPNITNMEIPARAAAAAGADGIAAINTIKSVAGINLDTFAPAPDVNGKSAVSGLSGNCVKPVALRFIHDIKACEDLSGIPVSGMGGIETWQDAVEFIALGCSNLQITTAVMQYGYRIIDDLVSGLSAYLGEKGYDSLDELMGNALANVVNADELNRETQVYPVFDRDRCNGCGRCYISCFDGGHQAISFGKERIPKLVGGKCVGCHLCMLVCPQLAINLSKRVPLKK